MKSVLVVDDDLGVLSSVEDMASKVGYHVYTAINLEEALKTFHEKKPGIIITDIVFGDRIDGVKLCNFVKMESPKIYVIAMTGYVSEYDLAYCLGAGFNDVIQKPFRFEFLKEVLNCATSVRKRWLTLNGCIKEEKFE